MYQTDYKPIGGYGQFNTILQLQDGRIDISEDGSVSLMRAGSAGEKVGKSAYSTAINSTDASGLITAEFEFMIPDGNPLSHIYLADLESNASSSGFNPGVRIQVRDGLIRVERGKIGIKELWPADQDELLQTGKWYTLKIVMRPGDQNSGEIQLYLDGKLVVDEQGQTMDTRYANGEIDRVQIGLTANVNDYDAALAVRNAEITVDHPGTGNDGHYSLNPLDALQHSVGIYRNGTEADPVYVSEINPDQPSTPEPPVEEPGFNTITGTPNDDVLKGTGNADAVRAFNGRDWLDGAGGSDLLRGGGGLDTISGGSGDDTVYGGTRGDRLYGDSGQDEVHGGKGYDQIHGGGGEDKLFGGNGKDKLFGGNGQDVLYGGAGEDTLKGGSGNDTFTFKTGAGQDIITDFAVGSDQVHLDFTSAELNALRFRNVAGEDGGVLIIQGEDSLLLQGVSYSDLSSSDFLLNGS
ncbi:M10 family metallopeptidase C-terminal domain-containing protein [Leisingera sp. ANG-S5]|uniref:M10 family metallopeptidase C-terminal domain-containing protein n=1 Tax=Leisingera sp. ANG-S5 TaxID=1577901 RepID=UPI00068FF5BA|nr:heparin lyase I family protein [Leisingera sp. ANG-S5]